MISVPWKEKSKFSSQFQLAVNVRPPIMYKTCLRQCEIRKEKRSPLTLPLGRMLLCLWKTRMTDFPRYLSELIQTVLCTYNDHIIPIYPRQPPLGVALPSWEEMSYDLMMLCPSNFKSGTSQALTPSYHNTFSALRS